MVTFLPFERAVKPHSLSNVLCAVIFGSILSCAGHRVSPVSAGLARATDSHEPLRSAATIELRHRPPPASPSPSAATRGSVPTPASELPVSTVLELEVPYSLEPGAARGTVEDEELARWDAGGGSEPEVGVAPVSFHPGTRVIVDTRLAKRRSGAPPRPPPRLLTLERVQAQTRSHGYWPFRLCFEAVQREHKSPGGETRIAFTIGSSGKVRAARLLDSELPDARASACMVRELLKLEFLPRPPRPLAMVASIRIYPGDLELAVPSDPSALPAPAAEAGGGAFDPLTMRARIEEKRPELTECFIDARRKNPDLWGRLALGLILEVDGSVHRVSEIESRFPSASVTRCVEALLATIVFPSVNGKPFSFVVALRLAPTTTPRSNPEFTTPSSTEPSSDPR